MTEEFIRHFFLCTLDDLRERYQTNLYGGIRSAGLLRHLLMDGEKSLVTLANKPERIKIRFYIRECQTEIDKMPLKWWGRLEPLDHEPQTALSIDKFLKAPVCIYEQYTYTAGDIIDYFSHFLGGIHSGVPRTEKEKQFTVIHDAYPFVRDWPSLSLVQIIRVVLKGLSPLEAAARSKSTMTNYKKHDNDVQSK